MNYSQAEEISAMNDEELVATYTLKKSELEGLKTEFGYIEMLITQRLEERGASVMRGEKFNIESTQKIEYDKNVLAFLREHFSADELSFCYTPEHQKTVNVEESWNMTKTKALAKHGDEIAGIINDARMKVGRMRLHLKERKERRREHDF